MLHTEQLGQFLFEGLSFRSEGQPKVERCADGGLDLVLIKDSTRVGNYGFTRDEGAARASSPPGRWAE